MPGALQTVVISPQSTVLPNSLCTSFHETHVFPMLFTYYPADGTLQRSLITDGVNAPEDIRIWTLSQRLTPATLATLYTFWSVTVLGGLKPFWFYDPFEPATGQPVGSNYDPTGVSTQGRVSVHFRGDWRQSSTIARTNVPNLILVQVE
jgi:hypothetical protein